jgi:hypothetical protein
MERVIKALFGENSDTLSGIFGLFSKLMMNYSEVFSKNMLVAASKTASQRN